MAGEAFETSRNSNESQRLLPRQRTQNWTDKAYSVLRKEQQVKAAVNLESSNTQRSSSERLFPILTLTWTPQGSHSRFTAGEMWLASMNHTRVSKSKELALCMTSSSSGCLFLAHQALLSSSTSSLLTELWPFPKGWTVGLPASVQSPCTKWQTLNLPAKDVLETQVGLDLRQIWQHFLECEKSLIFFFCEKGDGNVKQCLLLR